jgi:hypothetical protein
MAFCNDAQEPDMHQHRPFTFLAAGLFTLLTACGGGGGSTDTPNAQTLADNSVVATALAGEAQASIASAQRVPDATSLAQWLGLTGGVSGVSEVFGAANDAIKPTLVCPLGGSLTLDLPTDLSSLKLGTPYTLTFNNCVQQKGQVTDGVVSVSFSSFSNKDNFSETATYNLRVVSTTGSSVSFVGTQSCVFTAGAGNCRFNDGLRSFDVSFSNVNGTLNGSYSWAYGSDTRVDFSFNNWTTTAGTIVVTGPNNFRAVVVRDGSNSFTVTINGGAPRKVVLPG